MTSELSDPVTARVTELQTTSRVPGEKEIDNPMPTGRGSIPLDPQARRKAAMDLFNHTWTLLGKPDRTERETA